MLIPTSELITTKDSKESYPVLSSDGVKVYLPLNPKLSLGRRIVFDDNKTYGLVTQILSDRTLVILDREIKVTKATLITQGPVAPPEFKLFVPSKDLGTIDVRVKNSYGRLGWRLTYSSPTFREADLILGHDAHTHNRCYFKGGGEWMAGVYKLYITSFNKGAAQPMARATAEFRLADLISSISRGYPSDSKGPIILV